MGLGLTDFWLVKTNPIYLPIGFDFFAQPYFGYDFCKTILKS
jgi:hypothetical protein